MWYRYPVWIFWALGFLGALPLVLDFAGALWWVTLPVLGVLALVYWFWGMRWVYGADYAAMGAAEKGVALLVGLVQLFIGVVFAVFIVTFLVKNWVATALTVVLLAVVFIFVGREPKARPRKVVAVGPDKPEELVPEPSHQPMSGQDWIVHHLSVLFLLGFGAAMTIAMAMKRQDIVPPLEFATLGAYVVVTWIHIVGRGEPGQKPHSLLARIGMTFMTVVMTFVGIAVLVVAVEAAVEFWVWVVPVVGGLALIVTALFVWDHFDTKKSAAAAAAAGTAPPRSRFSRRDEIVR
jgi:hypothetical protein